ncbi:unnamed protein product [Brassicogethes aeneus]|uniref:PH domain-containing protein n=1 Tax=Brassicogethes aeneus TaxID=1431903 RepID=A0A9P0B1D2_BRAAE|nr:unnamed protein product [Brassicogethes aeneus]
MNIAKVVIYPHNGDGGKLFDLNKNLSVNEIVSQALTLTGLPSESSVYTLKLIKQKSNSKLTYYLNQDNLHSIENLDEFKVVFTTEHRLTTIFTFLSQENEARNMAFRDLLELSTDDAFIRDMFLYNKHIELMEMFIKDNDMKNNEIEACLLNFAHLFKMGFIDTVEPNILDKMLKIAKNEDYSIGEDRYSNACIKYSLMVLRNILINRNGVFNDWKQRIINELSFSLFLRYINDESYDVVKFDALRMINTFLKVYKKLTLIKEINQKKNREFIFNRFIKDGKLDSDTEHELYVCQTYLLSLYSDALNGVVKPNGLLDESEKVDDDIIRTSFVNEYTEENNSGFQMDTLSLSGNKISRYSITSVLSESSRNSSYICNIENLETDIVQITILTFECLSYCKSKCYSLFKQSCAEENKYKPGIFTSSDIIVKMLCHLLHVGKNPDKSETTYQPLVYCSNKSPFFMELFCRTLSLLSRTRREMKATSLADYTKVMRVVNEQIRMVLETKPMNFKELHNAVTNSSVIQVFKHWENKENKHLANLINYHPCIQELREKFSKNNRKYVLRQRFIFMHKKTRMQRVLSGTRRPFFKLSHVIVYLSDNNKEIHISDVTPGKKEIKCKTVTTINIKDVANLAHGKNCEQSVECSSDALKAFSLIMEDYTKILLIANNKRDASYWIDGLSILTNSDKETDLFKEELKTLVDMDVRLSLLDLQNVPIPDKAPKVPPLPETPPIPRVPPKSPVLVNNLSNRFSIANTINI